MLFLTTKERPLFALKVVIPLKLRGNIAALTAPPLPPLLLKVLQCKMICHYSCVYENHPNVQAIAIFTVYNNIVCKFHPTHKVTIFCVLIGP